MTRARKCVLLGVYANIGAGKSSPLLSFQFPFFLFFLEGKARYWSCFSCLLLTLLKIGENIFKHNRKRNLPNFTMPTSPSTGQSSALDAASSKSRITRLGYINSPPSLISPVCFPPLRCKNREHKGRWPWAWCVFHGLCGYAGVFDRGHWTLFARDEFVDEIHVVRSVRSFVRSFVRCW